MVLQGLSQGVEHSMTYHYENKLPKVIGFILLYPELCHGILKLESSTSGST